MKSELRLGESCTGQHLVAVRALKMSARNIAQRATDPGIALAGNEAVDLLLREAIGGQRALAVHTFNPI